VIIKLFLLGALGCLLLYSTVQLRRAFVPALVIAVSALAGAVLVVFPELSNDIAHLVGVGRGADLIFYCFMVATLAVTLNIHLRLRSEHEAVTALARQMALQTAHDPDRRAP
jgi:small membrane protein